MKASGSSGTVEPTLSTLRPPPAVSSGTSRQRVPNPVVFLIRYPGPWLCHQTNPKPVRARILASGSTSFSQQAYLDSRNVNIAETKCGVCKKYDVQVRKSAGILSIGESLLNRTFGTAVCGVYCHTKCVDRLGGSCSGNQTGHIREEPSTETGKQILAPSFWSYHVAVADRFFCSVLWSIPFR